MKMSRGMTAAFLMAGTIGVPSAMLDALEADSDERRRVVLGIDPVREPEKYGPGTGKIPEGFEPTERDKARIAQAEEKRARRHASNLRAIKASK